MAYIVGVDNTVSNSRLQKGLTVMDFSLRKIKESIALRLLELEGNPYNPGFKWRSAFQTATLCHKGEFFNAVLFQPKTVDNITLATVFRELRLAGEVRSRTLRHKFEVPRPSAYKIEACDLWTLDQILYPFNYLFANQKMKEKKVTTLQKSTLIPEALILPSLWVNEGPAEACVFSIELEVIYQSMLFVP